MDKKYKKFFVPWRTKYCGVQSSDVKSSKVEAVEENLIESAQVLISPFPIRTMESVIGKWQPKQESSHIPIFFSSSSILVVCLLATS